MLVLKAGNQKLQYHLTVLRSGAANDFYYKDAYRYGTPRVKNLNNHYRDAGILQNVYLDAGKGNYLESGIWFQKKELEIPAIMGSYEQSTAKQKDSLFRAYFSYRKKSAKSAILLRSAYLSDYLNYTSGSADDSISYIDSKINAGRIINETDFRHFFTPQLIAGGGISHGLIIGRSQNYGGRISENEFAIHANLKYVLKNLILNTGVRKEFYKGLNPTPQYSAGIRYLAAGNLLLRASFSTKFRKPSLNEKYWQPGGNPHLKPERGYGGEIAAEWNMDKDYQDDSDNSIILKGYYQTVDNWIQWVMADSLTPVEYKKVHAGGIEGWLNYSFKVYPFLLSGYLNYNYNRSTIVDTYDDNSLYKGNQLIYIPIHTIGASAALKFKGLILEVSGSYSGYRETVESADKSLRLPAYVLMDLALDYNTNLSNIPIDIWCRFDNVFDTNYEIIRSYAVPGRTIHLGLSIGFEKTRNKTNLNN